MGFLCRSLLVRLAESENLRTHLSRFLHHLPCLGPLSGRLRQHFRLFGASHYARHQNFLDHHSVVRYQNRDLLLSIPQLYSICSLVGFVVFAFLSLLLASTGEQHDRSVRMCNTVSCQASSCRFAETPRMLFERLPRIFRFALTLSLP
mmetsp:Transcript_61086/g.126075  ORF Transcript_61086/g.126075 Transcript_61086/m.126075 type:complete len:148 (+) Transcript_61086:2548-2991(+)